jgi:hypothetical protein
MAWRFEQTFLDGSAGERLWAFRRGSVRQFERGRRRRGQRGDPRMSLGLKPGGLPASVPLSRRAAGFPPRA